MGPILFISDKFWLRDRPFFENLKLNIYIGLNFHAKNILFSLSASILIKNL